MAGKPKDMNQVKQLLMMHHYRIGKQTIAKRLGISRNTSPTFAIFHHNFSISSSFYSGYYHTRLENMYKTQYLR